MDSRNSRATSANEFTWKGNRFVGFLDYVGVKCVKVTFMPMDNDVISIEYPSVTLVPSMGT